MSWVILYLVAPEVFISMQESTVKTMRDAVEDSGYTLSQLHRHITDHYCNISRRTISRYADCTQPGTTYQWRYVLKSLRDLGINWSKSAENHSTQCVYDRKKSSKNDRFAENQHVHNVCGVRLRKPKFRIGGYAGYGQYEV